MAHLVEYCQKVGKSTDRTYDECSDDPYPCNEYIEYNCKYEDLTEYFYGQYTIQACEAMAELIQVPFLIHTKATDKKPASCKCGESKHTCAGMAGPLTPKIQDCPQCSSSVPLQGDGQGVGPVIIGVIVAIIIIIAIIAYSIYRYVL